MNILLGASEAVPYIKTGGLADVIGSLLKEYIRRKKNARLFLPLYRSIKQKFPHLTETNITVNVPVGKTAIKGRVCSLEESVYFLECDEFFDRDEPYGSAGGDYPDNAARFVFFSRGILEVSKAINFKPDVIHCNDWQTGLVPLYLKTLYKGDSFFRNTATLFTIHNIGYQGLFSASDLFVTNLGWDLYNPDGIEFYGKINFLKAGILSADILSTVSETYAQEILQPEYGFGLDGVLRTRAADLYGVINGIDYSEWDPETDSLIPAHFNSANLSGKETCKKDIITTFFPKSRGSAAEKAPVLGMVGRLVEHKGMDAIMRSLPDLSRYELKFIILGKGEDFFQRSLSKLADTYQKMFALYTAFDEQVAHRVYAGCDFFIMPSRYEPCGLGQLIAMRYGCIPIARKTGGLADTIDDYDPLSVKGTGFLFVDYSPYALLDSIKRALCLYTEQRKMQTIIRNGMSMRFTWKRSAENYLELYIKGSKKKA
jgi:starch synthase